MMRCPYCRVAFNDNHSVEEVIQSNEAESLLVTWVKCPECNGIIINLIIEISDAGSSEEFVENIQIWPTDNTNSPAPPEVPPKIVEDYEEARLVSAYSSKACAALARRCLQNVLIECAGVKEKDSLANQIQQVLDSERLPTYISDDLDAVRNIGNFAAHPKKNVNTGEIVPVEPGEADWTLNILISLFDFYFVQPAKAAERRKKLDEKLAQIKKPPMKKSSD